MDGNKTNDSDDILEYQKFAHRLRIIKQLSYEDIASKIGVPVEIAKKLVQNEKDRISHTDHSYDIMAEHEEIYRAVIERRKALIGDDESDELLLKFMRSRESASGARRPKQLQINVSSDLSYDKVAERKQQLLDKGKDRELIDAYIVGELNE